MQWSWHLIIKCCRKCGGNGEMTALNILKSKSLLVCQMAIAASRIEGWRIGRKTRSAVSIIIQTHPLFERKDDLICEVPIRWSDAIQGCEIETPTLKENSAIKIPAGCQSHRLFKLSKEDYLFDGKRRGDICIGSSLKRQKRSTY